MQMPFLFFGFGEAVCPPSVGSKGSLTWYLQCFVRVEVSVCMSRNVKLQNAEVQESLAFSTLSRLPKAVLL